MFNGFSKTESYKECFYFYFYMETKLYKVHDNMRYSFMIGTCFQIVKPQKVYILLIF